MDSSTLQATAVAAVKVSLSITPVTPIPPPGRRPQILVTNNGIQD